MEKTLIDVAASVDEYLKQIDWRVNANANQGYSLGGLILNVSGKVIANYWLNHIYAPEIGEAHRAGDLHIHDLDMLSGYCAGWSLRTLLMEGFNGVPGKVEADPPKHLSSAVGQMVNFLGTLQNEWAGAVAFSSADSYLAPFVRKDNLSYSEVKQCIQELIYNLNVPSRWGSQTPFSNLTFDWVCPEDLRDQIPIIAGEEMPFSYGDLQAEMDMINRAFIEVMTEGDAKGRIFTFPLPTYNITPDFPWDSPNVELLFEMTAKYGLPYFCLEEHTEILTDNGIKKIKDITLSERVIGSDGQYKAIKNVFKTIKNSYLQITIGDNNTICCSENHRFPTSNGLKSADSLSLKDKLISYLREEQEIIKIEKINKEVNMVDLEIESQDHLFLMANNVMTHNSNFVNSDMKPNMIRSMCLFPEEAIWFKDNEQILKTTIGALFAEYKDIQLDEEWWQCKSNVSALSLNPQSGKLEWVKINKFLRVTDNRLVSISSQDGKLMRLSAHHLVAVFTCNGIETKKAEDVKTDDFVLVIKDENRWDSDFAAVPVASVNIESLSHRQEFYDIELEKNHYFVHSDGNISHNCCRLQLDLRELLKRGNGLFGSSEQTGCYDDETEVFTNNGWKFFKDVKDTDLVLSMDMGSCVPEFVNIDSSYEYDYDGELIHFKSLRVDLLVTENHRMVYKDRHQAVQVKTALEMLRYDSFDIPVNRAINRTGAEAFFVLPELRIGDRFVPEVRIPYKLWAEFMGFYLSEGSCDTSLIISPKNEDAKKDLERLLVQLPFSYYKFDNGYQLDNKPLCLYLQQFGRHDERFIPQELKEQSYEVLESFWNALIKGYKDSGVETSSLRLAEDIREILIYMGFNSTCQFQKERDCFAITKITSSCNSVMARKVPYKGKVYCLGVKHGTLLVKRKDHINWCGNSLGVVTINCARLGYRYKGDETALYQRLDTLLELGKESLEVKREVIQRHMDNGLFPFTKRYLGTLRNHFSTLGVNGINEMIRNFTNDQHDITTEWGQGFAIRLLDHIRARMVAFQEETGHMYNLEATPAEGTTYRFAKEDKKRFPDIIQAGTQDRPYYTNSSQLPVGLTDDPFEALELQNELQTKYTGGCIEKGNKVITNKGAIKIEEIVNNFKSLSPIRALSYNSKTGQSEWDLITDAMRIDVAKHHKIKVVAERGVEITTSDWHPFFVMEKRDSPLCVKPLRADELSEGDCILQNAQNLLPEKLKQNLYSFLDGHVGKREVEYCTVSEELADELVEMCTIAGVLVHKERCNEVYRVLISTSQATERQLPVVRVLSTSKVEVQDNDFYDLTTQYNHNYLAGNNSFVFVHNTVLHLYMNERISSAQACKTLIRRVLENYRLPYITVTPTFSICPVHGYLAGEHEFCPLCDEEKLARKTKEGVLDDRIT
jgi:anaerobic ribonucleoside-triphosphate reductase